MTKANRPHQRQVARQSSRGQRGFVLAIALKAITIGSCALLTAANIHPYIGISANSLAWLAMEASNERTIRQLREELEAKEKRKD